MTQHSTHGKPEGTQRRRERPRLHLGGCSAGLEAPGLPGAPGSATGHGSPGQDLRRTGNKAVAAGVKEPPGQQKQKQQ